MFLNPVLIFAFLIKFAICAAVLIALVRIFNEDDELDMQSGMSAAVICTALGMGWAFGANYLELHLVLQWLSYIPLAGLVGLVVALVSGIPVARAMAVGAMYVLFFIWWPLCLVIVGGLVGYKMYRQRTYAQSKQRLKERLAGNSPPGDSDTESRT